MRLPLRPDVITVDAQQRCKKCTWLANAFRRRSASKVRPRTHVPISQVLDPAINHDFALTLATTGGGSATVIVARISVDGVVPEREASVQTVPALSSFAGLVLATVIVAITCATAGGRCSAKTRCACG
jgi:hypothetical protein